MTAAPFRAPAQSALHRESVLQRRIEFLRASRLEEAEFALTAAHAQNPAGFDALHLLAILRLQQGRQAEALDLVKRALQLRPQSSRALGLQSRLLSDLHNAPARRPLDCGPCPRWDGAQVAGTLWVTAQQGLGEQVLHASMVPDLALCADKVVVEAEPRLLELFARSFPDVGVVPIGSARPDEAVAQVPMSGLARQLRPSWDAFPRRPQGFLVPDQARACNFRERLTGDGRVVIGLAWRSRRSTKTASTDSACLLDFESVLRLPKCRFIDLQHGDTRAERAVVERELGVQVEHLDGLDTTHDIDGLAALMAACDIVVTVSNTAAHLAGAIGRPTWVFLPRAPTQPWYWFDGRRDSPWYPHVRVERQASGQSWADLISSSADEIW
jgi:tetratricopeptide (TPR) repeat protein